MHIFSCVLRRSIVVQLSRVDGVRNIMWFVSPVCGSVFMPQHVFQCEAYVKIIPFHQAPLQETEQNMEISEV